MSPCTIAVASSLDSIRVPLGCERSPKREGSAVFEPESEYGAATSRNRGAGTGVGREEIGTRGRSGNPWASEGAEEVRLP